MRRSNGKPVPMLGAGAPMRITKLGTTLVQPRWRGIDLDDDAVAAKIGNNW